jgi:hypothetical protein
LPEQHLCCSRKQVNPFESEVTSLEARLLQASRGFQSDCLLWQFINPALPASVMGGSVSF